MPAGSSKPQASVGSSGGVVITPGPIDTYAPVEDAPKGIPVLQWEKEGTEAAGLVKIDLLGNRSLGVVRDCISSIREIQGAFTDFQDIDRKTTGHPAAGGPGPTMGCFYIESPPCACSRKNPAKVIFGIW